MQKIIQIPNGYTFGDVLLTPQYSNIRSRSDVNIKSNVSRNVPLNTPLVSSNMDTVTEDGMAIEMARNGGIGMVHRYCSIEEQVSMIKKIKRADNNEPYTASETDTIGDIKCKMQQYGINSFVIVDNDNVLKGILTRRDIKFMTDNQLVKNCMTTLNKLVQLSLKMKKLVWKMLKL